MMVARRGLTLLATAAFAAALFGASSTASAASIPASTSIPASAAEGTFGTASCVDPCFINHTTENFIKIRNCPGTNCGASGQADLSHALEDYCWAEGEAYPVAGAIFWDKIKDLKTGKKGWINEYYLRNRGQGTHC